MMARVLIFGDSITWGAWDLEEGGWVQRLKNFLGKDSLSSSDSDFTVYNLGISGDTTDALLTRLGFETKVRLREGEEIILVFAYGVNDSAFLHQENSLWVPLEKYKENLQKILEIGKKFSSKIIFIGLTPVDEKRTTPVSWVPISYKNENIIKFNNTLRGFCKENDVYFVEIYEKLAKMDYPNLLEDGAHPNSKGHKEIFEIVKKFFVKNIL